MARTLYSSCLFPTRERRSVYNHQQQSPTTITNAEHMSDASTASNYRMPRTGIKVWRARKRVRCGEFIQAFFCSSHQVKPTKRQLRQSQTKLLGVSRWYMPSAFTISPFSPTTCPLNVSYEPVARSATLAESYS
jgi:hypothetical protein